MKKEKKDLTQANTAVKSRDKKKIFMTIGCTLQRLMTIRISFVFYRKKYGLASTVGLRESMIT